MVLIFNLTISDVFFSLFLITLMFLDYLRLELLNKLWDGIAEDYYATSYEISIKLTRILAARRVFNVLTYRFSFLTCLLTHIAIASDRLYCVLRPIKYWQYKKRKYMILTSISIWVVASIITGLYLIWEFSSPKYAPKYATELEKIGTLFIPIVVGATILAIYLFIIRTYRKNNKSIESQTGFVSTNDIRRKEQERSLMKMSLAIVCSFYLCWIPNSCESLLQKQIGYKFNHNVSNAFSLMNICNTILNSIFYFPKTRRLVFNLLSRFFCRRN